MTRAASAIAIGLGLLLTSGSGPGHAEDLIRVGLAVPNNTIYAPFYAAEELGLFKQAGIKV
jgi:ABC-type nitrate/sulfonate/bicarbonate transport system substrate-binding protein